MQSNNSNWRTNQIAKINTFLQKAIVTIISGMRSTLGRVTADTCIEEHRYYKILILTTNKQRRR